MNPGEYLFIGGPADGQRLVTNGKTFHIVVDKRSPSYGDPMCPTADRFAYRAAVLRDRCRDYLIYVPDNYNGSVLEALIDRYPKPCLA